MVSGRIISLIINKKLACRFIIQSMCTEAFFLSFAGLQALSNLIWGREGESFLQLDIILFGKGFLLEDIYNVT